MSRGAPAPSFPGCGAAAAVPWGQSWDVGHYAFVIEDIYDHGRSTHTEAYVVQKHGCCAVHTHPETHNPMGHFRGSRSYCFAQLQRIAKIYACAPEESCPVTHVTCPKVRAFLETHRPELCA